MHTQVNVNPLILFSEPPRITLQFSPREWILFCYAQDGPSSPGLHFAPASLLGNVGPWVSSSLRVQSRGSDSGKVLWHKCNQLEPGIAYRTFINLPECQTP